MKQCSGLRCQPPVVSGGGGEQCLNGHPAEDAADHQMINPHRQSCCCVCPVALCRPAPEGTGWSYSKQLIEIVRQYKAHFPSVLAALEPSASAAAGSADGGDQRQRVSAAALFPGVPAHQLDTKLGEVRSGWCSRSTQHHAHSCIARALGHGRSTVVGHDPQLAQYQSGLGHGRCEPQTS